MTTFGRMLLGSLVLLFLTAPALAARDELRFLDVFVESETDTPRVCFQFSRPLDESGGVRYGDYIRFEPEFAADFSARGTRLCAAGVGHGQLYVTTLLVGLPDAAGKSLEETQRFNVSVPDRKPSLSFQGNAYILPGRGRRELPLDAVNVAEATVKILRINDRNLVNEINQGRVSSLLSRWDADRIASLNGELVWQGTIDIPAEKNRKVSTALPVGEILKEPEPGIYVVMAIPKAEREGYVYYEATQWMVVTDIGLTSHAGSDGMHVFLRSLQSARPLAGLDVRLVARNNEILGRGTTDAAGAARFDPGLLRGRGGAAPGAVMAFGPSGAFSFLDLTRPAFDLTDRGVGGRPSAGPIDAFVYTERGVYRPGETVNIVAMLRDERALSLDELPLTLRIRRPDGTEHDSVLMTDDASEGARHLVLPLSASARTGRWSVEALVDPEAPPVGRGHFQVEDFVPERMEVTLEPKLPVLTPRSDNEVALTARFLYGAPASDLPVEGEIVLQEDLQPYPELRGYKFGLVQEEWRPRREALPEIRTDADGRATIPVGLDEAPQTTRPLRALVRLAVAETGGRALARTVSLPVRSRERMIGIRPGFGDASVEQGQEAAFDIVAVDAAGATTSTEGLVYELLEETWRYHWFTRDDRWDYRVLIDETTIDSGSLSAASGPARLAFTLDWGRYRLEIHDPEGKAATSVRFRVGWFSSPVAADVPDTLDLSLDREKYRVGDVAKVHIRPPFAGRVLLTVAGGRVYETRDLDVPREGTVVSLPVKEAWDAGAYVTATLFRTAGKGEQHQPARAIGVAWLARDYSDRTLEVTIAAPERILPRQTVEIPVTVAGIAAGGRAYLTLAAVDEGILQLTGFETPSPETWYYGKRRLGVAIRDAYGHLIRAAEGGPARIRQGGDEAAEGRHLGGLDASSVKTVSLFSGIIAVGPDGQARIPLEIPDFNGRLRLMAVAWSRDKVGSADAPMLVRDPVVSQVTLPRFLAPGDESRVTVALHNVDGPAGAYRVSLKSSGAVDARGGGTSLTLERDARSDLAFSLTGERVGTGGLALVIQGPQGMRLERNWDIAVRPAQTVLTRQVVRRLQSRQRQTLSGDLLEDFVPGTGEVLVTLSTRPQMDLAELLKSLDRYPYGCVEQTTSRALPLLYVGEVAASLGIAEDALALRAKVQKAVRRVLAMQRSDGSFGLWSPTSDREEWLSAYVMDFLTQARELDYPVPDYPYRRGINWLAGSVRTADYSRANLPSRIYALYVLTRAGEVRISDLRYVHDVYLGSVPTALARAQLGAALALAGDRQRAESALGAASRSWDRGRRFWGDWWYWDYGTGLRDMAATVYLSAYANIELGDWGPVVQELTERAGRTRYLSTQEKAWMLLAASALGEAGTVRVSVAGRSLPQSTRPVYLRFDAEMLRDGVDLANHGDEPLWQGVTLTGVPRDELRAEREGFSVTRAFYTLDGKRADLDELRQGDVLVGLINGEAITGLDHQAMVVDLLPAGFELENASLEGGRDTDEMRWLPDLSRTRHTELRDDRFVAALALEGRSRRQFSLAYMVRAVSPGTYKLPAVYVEDMYQPTFFARGSMDVVTIAPAR